MKKIKEYTIVYARDYDNLSILVNDKLKKDWQPYGCIVINKYAYNNDKYCQPMVKYKSDVICDAELPVL